MNKKLKEIKGLILIIGLLFLANNFGYCQIPKAFQTFENQNVGGFIEANPSLNTSFKQFRYDYSVKVNNTKEFLKALSNSKNSVIFLNAKGNFDFSGLENIILPDGVSIVGDRGQNGSKGALVYSNTLKTNPLFKTGGNSITIFGIRFRGPDGFIKNKAALEKRRAQLRKSRPDLNTNTSKFDVYGIPNSNFIQVLHKGTLIENTEIFNWSHAGVFVKKGGECTLSYSYIHHNRRHGLGYGITNDEGKALIIGNLFDNNRHSIAGTGKAGTSYIAEGNVSLVNHTSHVFDMHGGRNRDDGTDIAGDEIIIRSNLFYIDSQTAFLLSGNPREKSIVENNLIIYSGKSKGLDGNHIKFYRQIGNGERFFVRGNKVEYSTKK